MPPITAADLAEFASRPDLELEVRGEGEGRRVEGKPGWFGGRLMRTLKVALGEDREAKQTSYLAAKVEVLAALTRAYGPEIGEKAFRAGIGTEVDGEHWMSLDHPITGRHVSKMIEVAHGAIADEFVTENFRDGFRDDSGRAMTERAVSCWIVRKADEEPSPTLADEQEVAGIALREDGRMQVGDVQVGLRATKVEGDKGTFRRGLDVADTLTKNLLADVDLWLADQAGATHGFWSLDLRLPRPLAGSDRHVIGIHVDRDDPNLINVFDANRREVQLSRDRLAGWLAGHLEQVYGEIGDVTLYRSLIEPGVGGG